MGVRICRDEHNHVATLYCSTSGFAFGPVFEGDDPEGDALAFLDWLQNYGPRFGHALGFAPIMGDGTDPREWSGGHLERLHNLWSGTRDIAEEVAS